MGMRDGFLADVEGFLRESGMSERRLGLAVAGDNKLLRRIRSGVNISFKTVESFERFAADWRADRASALAEEGIVQGV